MLSYLQRLFAQEFILAVLSEAIVEKEKKKTQAVLYIICWSMYIWGDTMENPLFRSNYLLPIVWGVENSSWYR